MSPRLDADDTPREFVVTVPKAEFRMSEEQAYRVMMTAHRRGVCVVAVCQRDIAETKLIGWPCRARNARAREVARADLVR
jgi:ATP-dependent Clp protease adapter protein ClpS